MNQKAKKDKKVKEKDVNLKTKKIITCRMCG